jgi:hypothetical protein
VRRRFRTLTLLAALALVLGLVPALAARPPARAQTAPVTFTSTAVAQHSSRCMDVPNLSTADNVQLIQWSCNGGANQSFRFEPISGVANAYRIVNTLSNKCVTVDGASTADNAPVEQFTCNPTATSHQFLLQTVSAANRTFQLAARHSNKCVTVTGASQSNFALLIQLPCTGATDRVWRVDGFTTGGGGGFQPLPALPVNACNNSSLPRSYGTNFPTPRDPFAFGFFNQSTVGWPENWYPVFAYLSGSYFARGVPTTFTQGGTTLCGAMYSFGVFTFGLPAGQAPPAQSIQWTMDSGYLPALRTSFTRNNVAISITNLGNRAVLGGNPFVLVYTRVSVTNNGGATVTVPPGGSGPNLVRLTPAGDAVAPGQTVNHDFVAAVDRFGGSAAFPSTATLAAQAPSSATAFGQMSSFWNGRIATTAQPSLPNVTLPDTGGLPSPGTALVNAYKAGTAYNNIIQVGKAPFSAPNNYAWLLNHDIPGELVARFSSGDFTDAQNLLLIGRISEQPGFNSVGANWYWDGVWKTPWAWAVYLMKTNDTAFVSQFFNDNQTQWGPSLRTMMRTHFVAQLDTDGTMRSNFDNDSTGKWILSNYSALIGLAAYKYIATRIGQTAEAQWADGAFVSLRNSLNTVIGNNQAANGFNFLPCEVHRPNTANRCNAFNDANWAQAGWSGQNQWDTMLMGGALSGLVGDPGQIDRMYQWGYDRIAGRLPFPTMGAFNGYSTGYNTAYSEGGLYGTQFRDLALTSYAWQIRTTTGGPNAWWEANGSGPSASNIWSGNHAGPQFGAVPYAWPIAHQQLALLRAVAAEGLTATGTGPFTYAHPLYVGRGVPNTWIAPGQTVSVSNLTSSFNAGTGQRSTYGVSIATTRPGTGRVVTVTISGAAPAGPVLISLPVFASSTVVGVTGGTYNSTTRTVTAPQGTAQVTITLNN